MGLLVTLATRGLPVLGCLGRRVARGGLVLLGFTLGAPIAGAPVAGDPVAGDPVAGAPVKVWRNVGTAAAADGAGTGTSVFAAFVAFVAGDVTDAVEVVVVVVVVAAPPSPPSSDQTKTSSS